MFSKFPCFRNSRVFEIPGFSEFREFTEPRSPGGPELRSPGAPGVRRKHNFLPYSNYTKAWVAARPRHVVGDVAAVDAGNEVFPDPTNPRSDAASLRHLLRPAFAPLDEDRPPSAVARQPLATADRPTTLSSAHSTAATGVANAIHAENRNRAPTVGETAGD